MMKCTRSILVLCGLLFGIVAPAQNISVTSFKLLENDLTANTTGTMEIDQNGEVAALIKVVTTEHGFVFDGGMVGIVRVKQEVGEIWAYVPRGIKRLTIKHPTLGVLRDYYFSMPIEKARTYEMVLSITKADIPIERNDTDNNIRANSFVLKVDNSEAMVFIDGELYMTNKDGIVSGILPYGKHHYRVEAVGYETKEGEFSIGVESVDIKIELIAKKLQNHVNDYMYLLNWYVQGQFGGQHTIGEIAFTDLNSLNAQIGVGYNFDKIWGTRLAINGWKSRAGWLINNDVLHKWAWNYVSPMVDVTANLSNWFLGYNPDRLVNFGVFAGIGVNIAFGNDQAADINEHIKAEYNFTTREALRNRWEGTKAFFTGRVGANVDFRFSSKWAAALELQANAVNDKYNSKRSGEIDRYFNILIGVKHILDTKK